MMAVNHSGGVLVVEACAKLEDSDVGMEAIVLVRFEK